LSGRRQRADSTKLGVCVALVLACLTSGMVAAIAGPTPEEYAAKVGGDAKIVPAGELAIDGRKVICGKRPTVLDNKLDDYGAAYPGFLILNPKLLARVSPSNCGFTPTSADTSTAARMRRRPTALPYSAAAGRAG